MQKFKRISPVLWFILALVLVGQFSIESAAVSIVPSTVDWGEPGKLLDDSTDDSDFDSIFSGVSVQVGTTIQSKNGFIDHPCKGCGIECTIPGATGPPPRFDT
ncbi:MAG: hypothetical protein O3A85_11560 [Proteobacteria bacterium]|nr:hypothetical protein [Pseudomonadota bacterium]